MAKKLYDSEFWFRDPQKKARGGPKIVKILNFFIIWARTFKFSGYIDFGTQISYLLKFFRFHQKMNFWEFFWKNAFFPKYSFWCYNSQTNGPIFMKFKMYILVVVMNCCIVLMINSIKNEFLRIILIIFFTNLRTAQVNDNPYCII